MLRLNPSQNGLFSFMRDQDINALLERCEDVHLSIRDMLEVPNVAIRHIYFPDSGVVSMVVCAPDGRKIEAGLIGKEGMTGLPIVLSSDYSPHECFVQIEGQGKRIEVDAFSDILRRSSHLQVLLHRYSQALNTQIAYTALINGRGTIPERLARWLLMCEDRVGDPTLRLTHEFLSLMLGIRRPGVTDALHILEGHRFIRSERGVCTIIDRQGLINLVEGFYGVPEAQYDRLLRQSGASGREGLRRANR